ncbi:MAG: hypothetical protein PXY39_06720, partial [archaeon]|nr:hypothetical protein [archaeon]
SKLTDAEKVRTFFLAANKYDMDVERILDDVLAHVVQKEEKPPIRLLDFVLSETPYLSLTTDGLGKTNLREIIAAKEKTVKVYVLSSTSKENFIVEPVFVESCLGSKLSKDEVVLIISPMDYAFDRERNYESFTKLLEHDNVEYLRLHDMISAKEFSRVGTEIDYLLPKNSFFALLEAGLRSAVLCKKRARLRSDQISEDHVLFGLRGLEMQGGDYSESLKDFRVRLPETILVRELFDEKRDDSAGLKIELLEHPTLIFDLDDDMLKILLDNASRIRSNTFLEQEVRNYLLILSTYFISPEPRILSILNSQEGYLCSVLNQGKRPPYLKDRLGPISRLLTTRLYVVFLPMSPNAYSEFERVDHVKM